jgi:transcriptional regulator of acetoin/glycerol metabolism
MTNGHRIRVARKETCEKIVHAMCVLMCKKQSVNPYAVARLSGVNRTTVYRYVRRMAQA